MTVPWASNTIYVAIVVALDVNIFILDCEVTAADAMRLGVYSQQEGFVSMSAANHLSDVERSRMEAELAKHYGEPVRPVSQYCNALRDWAKVASISEDEASVRAATYLHQAALQISKSNLLWRLIYGGEALRKEPCPVHEGRWSGYHWSDEGEPCACQYGLDVTGWLPNGEYEPDPPEEDFVIRLPEH